MSGERARDEVLARRLDWSLREVTGGERAPDVTEAVLRRAAAGQTVDDRTASRSRGPSRLLVAAVVLLGLGAVAGVYLLDRGDGAVDAPDDAPVAPQPVSQERQEPGWVRVTSLDAIRTMPAEIDAAELYFPTDATVKALVERYPRLQNLRVDSWLEHGIEREYITDAAFADIGRLRELRRLDLIGTKGVVGDGFLRLAELPLLAELRLRHFYIPDQALAVLPRLPSLTALQMFLVSAPGVGEAEVEAVSALPNLRRLSLSARMQPERLRKLGRLTGLVELELHCWDEGGLSTADLPGFPELRRIDLGHNGEWLGPDIGERLRKTCPKLREVVLARSPNLNDIDVAELLGLRWLRSLDVSDCPKVSEFSVPLLVLATQLRDVGLDGDTFMTLDLAEQLILRGRRPRCRLQPGTQAGDGMPAAEFNAGMAALQVRYARLLSQPHTELVREPQDFAELAADVRRVDVAGRFLVTAEAFARLATHGQLESLGFAQVDGIDAAGLAQLAELRALRSLQLTNVGDAQQPAATEPLLAPLPGFPALDELRITGAGALGGRGLAAITACTKLRVLELNGCGDVPSAALAGLGRLTGLETLYLIATGDLDDEAVAGLAPLHRLEDLALWRGRFSAAGLRALEGMHALRSLVLNENPVLATPALLHVPVGIEELGLEACNGLDAGAARLLRDRFPGLRKLYLAENRWLDDEALGIVLQLPRLEVLDLRGCNTLTQAAVGLCGAARSLRRLNVWSCTWMTDELAQELAERRPDLELQRERR